MDVDDATAPDAERHARLIADNLVLSAEATVLYPSGGFAGDAAAFARLRNRPSTHTRVLAEMFGPFRLERASPLLSGGSASARRRQIDELRTLAPPTAVGPATVLCESRDIRFSGNTLFYLEDGLPQVLYETFRPNDRYFAPGPGADFAHVDETVPEEGIALLLNSVGSFNYGHWLTDDLPRLRAVARLRRIYPAAPLTIFLVSYHAHIDEVRRRSIALYLPRERGLRIRFLDRDRAYRFARLHHVTPVSLPPSLKSPEALRSLAEHVHDVTRPFRWKARLARLAGRLRGGPSGSRLFVERNPMHERGLLNRDAVVAHLVARGFEPFDPERETPRRQALRFMEAEIVVGVAGAAMTNTVFCAPGTRLAYLMPETWCESFYWDLAAARGHRYAAVLGASGPGDRPEHLRTFAIRIADLDAALAALGAAD